MINKMKIIIVDNGSRHIRALENLCSATGEVEVQSYDDLDKLKDAPNTVLVLSGSHNVSVNWHKKLYKKEIQLIQQSKMPIIGVCFGFELIASSYGATLSLRKRRLHRVVNIKQTRDDPVLKNIGRIIAYQSHKWMVKSVASPLIELARSRSEVEVLKHNSKQIYAMQFHPEVGIGKNNGSLLFQNILNSLKLENTTR